MVWSFVAVATMVITAVAQDSGAPGISPPGMMRPEVTSTAAQQPEPCPVVTGREWICQMDWWDSVEQRVTTSEIPQPCDSRDLCYLGPLWSRPLKDPWMRKWMCGPKPCRVVGTDKNEDFEEECQGPMDTCDVGPYDLTVNGTRLQATFCNPRPVPPVTSRDSPEIMWASQICSVNSSLNGFTALKGCEEGEMCRRGPVEFWHEGNQYRAFMCTKTPSMQMQSSNSSKPQQLMYRMHKAMVEMGDALIMKGYVMNEGPHKMIGDLGQKMMNVRSLIENEQQKAKNNGDNGPFKLSDFGMKLLHPMQTDIQLLKIKVHNLLGGGEAGDFMDTMKEALTELFQAVNGGKGEPDMTHLMNRLHQHMTTVISHVKKNDLNSPMAKVAYVNSHEALINVKSVLSKAKNGLRSMEVLKTMGRHMQQLWNLMSDGPIKPDTTGERLTKYLVDSYKMLQRELMAMKSPEDHVEDAMKILEELHGVAGDGKIRSESAKKVFNNIHEKLVLMHQYMQSLPENSRAMEAMVKAADFIQETWNHMSGGPVTPMSRPELAIQGVMDALGDVRVQLSRAGPMNHTPDKPTDPRREMNQNIPEPGLEGLIRNMSAHMNQLQGEMNNMMTQMMGNMMPNMGNGNNVMAMGEGMQRDMMGSDAGMKMADGANPCPEQYWMTQIPPEHKIKWRPAEDAFMGPRPAAVSEGRSPPNRK